MATEWVTSLQCKSRAIYDVVNHHRRRRKIPKHRPLPLSCSSCKKTEQSLENVIDTTKQKNPTKIPKQPTSIKSEPGSNQKTRVPTFTCGPFFPPLKELPVGHPSRNVVEIIFRSSWSPKSFSARVEMVFKIRNSCRTMTRFEGYRERVKSRVTSGGGEDHARCAADGNEVMGFHCLGQTDGCLVYEGAWKREMCIFSSGDGAHESAGAGRGRRAMLVCRVIAGQVSKDMGIKSLLEDRVDFDSVSGYNGELLVFDTRGVLPCFLIIYEL